MTSRQLEAIQALDFNDLAMNFIDGEIDGLDAIYVLQQIVAQLMGW